MPMYCNWIIIHELENGDAKLVRLDQHGKETDVVFYIPKAEREDVARMLIGPWPNLMVYDQNETSPWERK